MLDAVDRNKVVWNIGYADVADIGELFRTGVILLNGSCPWQVLLSNPRLIRTRVGACVDELVEGELTEGENRILSGSVLNGVSASGEVLGYLGRYAVQVSALAEGSEREFLGWMMPGANKFSILPTYFYALFGQEEQVAHDDGNPWLSSGDGPHWSVRAGVPSGHPSHFSASVD